MSHQHKVVAIVGSTSAVSRTKALAEAIVETLATRVPVAVEYLELRTLAPQIGTAFDKSGLGPQALAALKAIEGADLIVAATPVYKASYSGLFKHLIDFIAPDALVGRPVLLAATGGSDRHALVVDQSLRSLFSFFRAQTVPSAVYASEGDFDGYTVRSEPLKARILEAARQAERLLGGTSVRPREEALLAAA